MTMKFQFVIFVDDQEVKKETIDGPCKVKDYDVIFNNIIKEAKNYETFTIQLCTTEI